MRIAILGPPGSGKSTQAELLSKMLSLPHVSTGRLLRTSNDLEVHSRMARGDLVDDDRVNRILDRVLSQASAAGGFVLDGTPRTMAQVGFLESKYPLDRVIHLRVSHGTALRRLVRRGDRPEDRVEIARERLVAYPEMIAPVLGYYRRKGVLEEVPAEGEPAEVLIAVRSAVGPWLS